MLDFEFCDVRLQLISKLIEISLGIVHCIALLKKFEILKFEAQFWKLLFKVDGKSKLNQLNSI